MPDDYPIRLSSQLRDHLKSLRKQRGLTQAELGRKMGLSQVRIAEIENSPGLVGVDQMLRLLMMLGGTLILRSADDSKAQLHSKAATKRTRQKGSW